MAGAVTGSGPVRAEQGGGDATWRAGDPPVLPRPAAPRGWGRVLRRGIPAIAVLLAGVVVILPLRGTERLFHGSRRPWTGPLVQGVCRLVLRCIGLRWTCEGQPMLQPGAVVANHSSWLDILIMNAALPVFFVAKSEVRGWPGVNILTGVTNTHFVVRDPKHARGQAEEFAARVRAGHRLLFFPEGTSTDGRRVLRFKPTLFQAFLDDRLPPNVAVQPMSVAYHAPEAADDRFYGWWADMALAEHLLAVLSAPEQGSVQVLLHPPIPVGGESRKSLAHKAEVAVRSGVERCLATEKPA